MNAQEVFLEYTSRFDTNDGKIKLKILHTQEVVKVMNRLTGMLNLPYHVCMLAEIIAAFHDIGRFEQVRRYHTFSDKDSVDHAELGCRVLEEEHLLDALTEREKKQVLTAIGNHNKYQIEEGLDPETETLCKLIRDADKIDIFRVFATEDLVDTMGETREQVAEEAVSDDVYEKIMAHEQIPKAIRKTGIDIWVGFLGFLFGLYFEESKTIIAEHHYYRRQFEQTQFKLPQTQERTAAILKEVDSCLPAVNVSGV